MCTSYMDSLKIPPGFKFKPNDEELLNFYLKPKIYGMEVPCNIIVEKQIYGPKSNPWDVFDFSDNSEKIVYGFTRLTKKAEGGSCTNEDRRTHYVKKAGCGTWNAKTPRKLIMDNKNNVIGTKRMLVFQINDVTGIDLTKVGYYRMHEYLLSGYEDYALCQITLDTSKNATVVDLCPKAASRSVSTTKPKANKETVGDCHTAKLCPKAVSRSVSTTNPQDNKIIDANPRAHMDESNEQVALTESRNNVASASSVFPYDSDQGIVTKGLPRYCDVGCARVEENVCQGFALGDGDQGLNYEEAALIVMHNTKDFENSETEVTLNVSRRCKDVITSDSFGGRSWSEKDLEDLFGEVSCGNNVQQQENMNCNQGLEGSKSFEAQEYSSDFSRDNVTLNTDNLLDDIGSWTEEEIDNFIKEVLNDSDVQQPPVQDMSCSQVLGKRKSLEAQEYSSGQEKKLCM